MKLIHSTAATLLALLLTLFIPLAIAGPGHDHGDTAPQATSSALPRFTAVSEDLELVGIVNGKLITLYLDRFKDNSPVNDAQIEIDIAGSKYQAQKHADGEYEVTLKEPLKPGVMAITATIKAGELIDLLATELDLHADADAPGIRDAWKAIAMWIGAGLLAMIALGAIVRFRHQARRA
ncbi:MAG: hypothetical protein EB117_08925 [Betaproteobacteria bacterium]|nr:hypothetical protein [Betaproteobacteria bacterium]